MVHIGDIRQAFAVTLVETIAEDRKVFMEAANGSDSEKADREGLTIRHVVKSHFRKTRIEMFLKDVMVVVFERIDSLAVGIDIHVAMLDPVEGAYVVNTTDVVAMGVSDEYGFQMTDIVREHLGSEIGTNIDKYIVAVAVGDDNGCP